MLGFIVFRVRAHQNLSGLTREIWSEKSRSGGGDGNTINLGVDIVVAVTKIAWGEKRRLEVQDAQSSIGS
jgi:hypothetical protein